MLQLTTPTRVKLIQILSHQFKISSRCEVYYFNQPKEKEDISGLGLVKNAENDPEYSEFDNSLNYQKIGYFSFDDNRASDFQAREMKSVFVDVTT